MSAILVDTGPIVAYLREQERSHAWAVAQFQTFRPPLLTCEAVLVEAAFLLRRSGHSHENLLALLETGALSVAFDLEVEAAAVSALMVRYQSLPMDLADACLLRMTELYSGSILLTLDSDFHIYRKNRNQAVPVITP